MNNAIEQLQRCADRASLASTLRELCAQFGGISSLRILTVRHEGKRRAVCFLRMDSAQQEQRLLKQLRFGRYAGDLVVAVDLAVRSKSALPAADAQSGPP